jgi:NADH-quinone oxidoreductase subunit J
MNKAIFYLFAALVFYSAFFVVTARNLFRSALGLIAVLLGVAGMYLLMDAPFMSAIQVTVYVGGIVVLIVYVILLVADVTQKDFPRAAPWRKGVAGVVGALWFALLAYAIMTQGFMAPAAAEMKAATITQIGRALLSPERSGFVLPFEVISLVLIAALIGAVTLANEAVEGPKNREEK